MAYKFLVQLKAKNLPALNAVCVRNRVFRPSGGNQGLGLQTKKQEQVCSLFKDPIGFYLSILNHFGYFFSRNFGLGMR